MTTIAFKDDIIAYDTRMTSAGTIYDDNYDKHRSVHGYEFFFKGMPADINNFIKFFFDAIPYQPMDISALVYDTTENILYDVGVYEDDKRMMKLPLDRSKVYGYGSGGDWAVAAMDFGCTAKEAVKYAMTRDSYSGGKVKTYKLK